ncbi:hypothetical protein ACS0TY_029082 [Phlomoides rotata]
MSRDYTSLLHTRVLSHIRKLKNLAALRSSLPVEFRAAVWATLSPLFDFQRRIASYECIIKFASVYACSCGGKGDSGDEFLENFLNFLIAAAVASNKTARKNVETSLKVYFGGIPYYSTEDDIRSYFEGCGTNTITSIDCMTFPDSGKLRGIAIITYKVTESSSSSLSYCSG